MLKKIRFVHLAIFFLILTVVFVLISNVTSGSDPGRQILFYYLAAGSGMISALFFLIYTLRR
jgi:uncharacterized membrane protein YciS (DUF1049 family)